MYHYHLLSSSPVQSAGVLLAASRPDTDAVDDQARVVGALDCWLGEPGTCLDAGVTELDEASGLGARLLWSPPVHRHLRPNDGPSGSDYDRGWGVFPSYRDTTRHEMGGLQIVNRFID